MISLKDNQYVYFPKYNRLINKEFKEIFLKNLDCCKPIEPIPVNLTTEDLANRIKTLKYVTFEVTQNCNLRCKYCVFVADYVYNRKLTAKKMKFATAEKTLNYLYNLTVGTNEAKQFAVGFYGGEPLLNFTLIKEVVHYTKERFAGWDVTFNMTTNGTLLDDAIIDFIIRNNFSILVSLDGPEEVHDSKRKFASGKGTFAVVMENLRKIHQRDPKYFKNQISLNSTFSIDLSLLAQYEFFVHDDFIKEISMWGGYVAPADTLYFDQLQYDHTRFTAEHQEVLSKIREKARKQIRLTHYEKEIIQPYINLFRFLSRTVTSDSAQTCLFNGRMFVDVDGRFHMCERINNQFPIGDMEHGHDLKRMKHYLDSFMTEVKQKCTGCDYKFFCPRCYVNLAKDGQFIVDEKFCNRIKRGTHQELETMIGLQEEGVL